MFLFSWIWVPSLISIAFFFTRQKKHNYPHEYPVCKDLSIPVFPYSLLKEKFQIYSLEGTKPLKNLFKYDKHNLLMPAVKPEDYNLDGFKIVFDKEERKLIIGKGQFLHPSVIQDFVNSRPKIELPLVEVYD